MDLTPYIRYAIMQSALKGGVAMEKIGAITLILIFGALFVYALVDGNRTGILTTAIVFLSVLFTQVFVLVPRLRRWNQRG